MDLIYVGPLPASVGGVPLPEGWPAASHAEPDEALAAVKLAWRFEARKLPGWGGKPAYTTPVTRGRPQPATEV